MTVFKLSFPTKTQIIHSIERVIGVFVVAAGSIWQLSNFSLAKATVHASILAGLTAVYQLILSSVTTI